MSDENVLPERRAAAQLGSLPGEGEQEREGAEGKD